MKTVEVFEINNRLHYAIVSSVFNSKYVDLKHNQFSWAVGSEHFPDCTTGSLDFIKKIFTMMGGDIPRWKFNSDKARDLFEDAQYNVAVKQIEGIDYEELFKVG